MQKTRLVLLISLLFSSLVFAQEKRALADSLYYTDHFEEAKALYSELIEEDPSNALVTYRYGYVHYRTGELEKGIELIKKSLELNQDKVPALTYTAWSRLAKIYSLKGEKETALNWLEKAVDKGYKGLKEFEEEPHFANIRQTEKFLQLKEKLEKQAYPCKYDPKFRELDYWIGEWDVYPTGGANLVGFSKIESVSQGCAILENWTSLINTHEGKSLNYYNSEKGYWEQHWQGSLDDRQTFTKGILKENAMRFEFIDKEGLKGTLTFFKLDDNTVRQYSETQKEANGDLLPAYDLTYKRKLPN